METIKYKQQWVRLLAEQLVIDVTEWMAGIHLAPCPALRQEGRARPMDAVCGWTEGELELEMWFEAEPRMLRRLAGNILGDTPESDQEVREYATEYFNVLCGRFISELCRGQRPKLRFHSPRYVPFPHFTPGEHVGVESTYFLSDEQEQVVLSWVIRSRD